MPLAFAIVCFAGLLGLFLVGGVAYLRNERARETRLIQGIPSVCLITKNCFGLLSAIGVHGPEVDDQHVPLVMHLRHLRVLFVDATSVSLKGAAELSGHPSIRLLAIAQSSFGEAELGAILANLRASELELLKMNLSPECVEQFTAKQHLRLRRLILPRAASQWSNWDDFQRFLPGCEIIVA